VKRRSLQSMDKSSKITTGDANLKEAKKKMEKENIRSGGKGGGEGKL